MTLPSLSTSWNALKHTDGETLIREILGAGFDTVELSFNLTAAMVQTIARLVDEGVVRVSSLHNMCPLPPEITPSRASPDHYALSSLDESARCRAVAIARTTIVTAQRLRSRAVVLHLGRVEIPDHTRELATIITDPAKARALRERMIADRAAAAPAHMDAVIRSLDELVPYAREHSIALGVENRYYHREIPDINEMAMIFARFSEPPLYYWHDAGHAESFDRLGLVSHRTLLERYAHRLFAMHLHDIIGPNTDHQPPGRGTLDFTLLKPYLGPSVLRVLEIHQPATAADIRRGAEYLREVCGD